MTTLQAFLLGIMVALTPSLIFLAIALRKLPRIEDIESKREFE